MPFVTFLCHLAVTVLSIRRHDIVLIQKKGNLYVLPMKTLLSILAHNIRNGTQMITEVYLRRAALRQGPNFIRNRRRSFYFQHFRSGRSYLKYRR